MDLLLQIFDVERSRIADHEIDEGGDYVELDQPGVALGHGDRRGHEVGETDHEDQRGVLEQDDRLGQQDRHHVAEGLRQHDEPHALRIAQAEGVARRRLPARRKPVR